MHDSAWGRLIAVLTSPTRTFQSISARPTWVPPLVVLMVLTVAASAIVVQRIDFDEAIREAIARQGQEMSDEQIERFAGMQSKFGLGCSVIIPPVAYLVTAAVLMAAFNLAGGTIKFKTSWVVTLHAMMPWAVATLLLVPVVLAQAEVDADLAQANALLASSAAAFAPPDTGPVLLMLLSQLDLFSLWTGILLAIGYSIAAGVTRGKAAVTVVVLWLVYVAFRVGLAALGAAFGGAGGGG